MNRRENMTASLVGMLLLALGLQFFLGSDDSAEILKLAEMQVGLMELETLHENPEQWAELCENAGAAGAALKDLQDIIEHGIPLHIKLRPNDTEYRLALFIRTARLAESLSTHTRRTK